MLEKDQSEAGNASIPSMYVSKTDGGHQAAYPNRTRSLVGCRKAPFHSGPFGYRLKTAWASRLIGPLALAL